MSCSSPTKTYTPTAKGATRSGWRFFERGDFTKALEKFNAALELDNLYLPAYSGKIWTNIKLDSIANNFSLIELSDGIATDSVYLKLELSAAEIYTYFAVDSFEKVINYYESNENNWSDFVFLHDKNITEQNILIMSALSYFYTKNYIKSAEIIKKILPTWEYSKDDPDLPSKILNVITNLYKK